MTVALWSLVIGGLLIFMVLVNTLLARLPLSATMIYLGLGYLFGLYLPDADAQVFRTLAPALERCAEVAVLISIFGVGLRLGVPLRDRRWVWPVLLAFPSMVLTVALIGVVAHLFLHLPWGVALLLGGILAPTDPVLASAIHSDPGEHPDRIRFCLAGEGALNDGSAFPFVLLGLGLMGLHDLGPYGWHWLAVDLAWATVAGLLIGAVLGTVVSRVVVRLRTRYHHAYGLNEFLSLGLIAVAYGTALLTLASGFLAVFAAGLAFQRVRELQPVVQYGAPPRHADRMTHSVGGFNEQLERLAEFAIVLVVGAMLRLTVGDYADAYWFIPVFFLIVRPLAVGAMTAGGTFAFHEWSLLAWFGIRGIGSLYYLAYALNHGLAGEYAARLTTLTVLTIAVSIVVHGMSALPLMGWYGRARQEQIVASKAES